MTKKILILSGSPRHGGNSDTLCDQFLKGASEAGHEVEKYFISAHNTGYCSACYYCSSHDGVCCKKDDMSALMPKILEADVLVFGRGTESLSQQDMASVKTPILLPACSFWAGFLMLICPIFSKFAFEKLIKSNIIQTI